MDGIFRLTISYIFNESGWMIRQQISLLFLLLIGCSSIAVHVPVKIRTNDNVILIYYCVNSSSQMNVIDKTLADEQNKSIFESNINNAIDDIRNHAGSEFPKSPLLEFRELTACKENLDLIPADASLYLMLKLSGYGSIKTKWKNILIFAGAVEAVVQGIAVGVASQNEWLGLGVAAEEMTSEYLTWNGVDWLLGETCA